MRWWVENSASFAAGNHRWMLWNLLLAFVPAGLAGLAFGPPDRPWPAVRVAPLVLFVLFLPNAPYVVTDVVHLFAEIRAGASDAAIIVVIVPVYGAFILTGLASYVYCLNRLRDRLAASWRLSSRRLVAIELGVHFACAVGVVLGRVVRLNSWHAFTRPASLTRSAWIFGERLGQAALVLAFVMCVGAAWFGRSCVQSVRRLPEVLTGKR